MEASEAPEKSWLMDLLIGSVVVVGRQDYEPAVDGERLEFDGKSETFLVREGGSDFGTRQVGPDEKACAFGGVGHGPR
jgi:hypothetical protein